MRLDKAQHAAGPGVRPILGRLPRQLFALLAAALLTAPAAAPA